MIFLLACHAPRPVVLEPDGAALLEAAEAEAARLVPDAARGGPPLVQFASPLPPFSGVSRSTARYVGEAACAPCHASAAATWDASAHASAWAALEGASAGQRADCVGCHATGYRQPGGFRDPAASSLALGQVGCEACHGPGSDHVAACADDRDADGYGELPSSDAACVGCHSWERSPDFRWAAAWPIIAHGL